MNLKFKSREFDAGNTQHHKHHAPLRDRFGNDTLYENVKTMFRRDIELYEWSKTHSIVVCNNTIVN
jgi:hypothetical protein